MPNIGDLGVLEKWSQMVEVNGVKVMGWATTQ